MTEDGAVVPLRQAWQASGIEPTVPVSPLAVPRHLDALKAPGAAATTAPGTGEVAQFMSSSSASGLEARVMEASA